MFWSHASQPEDDSVFVFKNSRVFTASSFCLCHPLYSIYDFKFKSCDTAVWCKLMLELHSFPAALSAAEAKGVYVVCMKNSIDLNWHQTTSNIFIQWNIVLQQRKQWFLTLWNFKSHLVTVSFVRLVLIKGTVCTILSNLVSEISYLYNNKLFG